MISKRSIVRIFLTLALICIVVNYGLVLSLNNSSEHQQYFFTARDPVASIHDPVARSAMINLYQACDAAGIKHNALRIQNAYVSLYIDSSPLEPRIADRLGLQSDIAVPHLVMFIGGSDSVAREALRTSVFCQIDSLSISLIQYDSRFASSLPPVSHQLGSSSTSRYDVLFELEFHLFMIAYGSIFAGIFCALYVAVDFLYTIFARRRKTTCQDL